jgi:hypothetical protein
MIRNQAMAAFAVCTVILALGQNRAEAQHTPFWIVGHGIGPQGLPLPGQPPRPHTATGFATHFGSYHGAGQVETDTANFLPNGDITGQFGSPVPFVFTATNGDKLACYYGNTDFGASNPGTFTLLPVSNGVYVAFFIAEFVPYLPGYTGQFAGVTGSWIMLAKSDPFVLGSSDQLAYSWQGIGSLTFSH